jgi:HlyD family secretion protein
MNTADRCRRDILRLTLVGFALVALMSASFGGWASTSRIAGAVVAPGTVVIESSIKNVQHPTGGVVKGILVHDGDAVAAGQPVLRLDDTLTKATLGIVRSQFYGLAAREARLVAEREGSDTVTFPIDLIKHSDIETVASAMGGEQKLFISRRKARAGEKAQLRERIRQTEEEIRGLSAQRSSKEDQVGFTREELRGVVELYQKKLSPIMRYMQLEREQSKLQGEIGQLMAEIARARVKISETKLKIIQIDEEFRTSVLADLRDVQGKISETRERMIAAEDQLEHLDIRAPKSGVVHHLSIHTIGGVISAGETIMQIVPSADELVIDARIPPRDIDQLSLGSKAEVRIIAGDQRILPNVEGTLVRVDAALTHEQQTNQAYYVARIALNAGEAQRLPGLKLVSGMTAEVFIQTHERTVLQYLLKPIRDQIALAFRER